MTNEYEQRHKMRRILPGLRFETREEENFELSRKVINNIWLYGTPVTDLGKYASLLYGISEVVKDDPSMLKLFSAGAVYVTSSFFHNINSNGANRLMHDILGEKIDESK